MILGLYVEHQVQFLIPEFMHSLHLSLRIVSIRILYVGSECAAFKLLLNPFLFYSLGKLTYFFFPLKGLLVQ